MTKIQLNEKELTKIISEATKLALEHIIREGAGFDTMKQSFNAGLNGYEVVNLDGTDVADDYINNGSGVDYDLYKQARNEYDSAARYEKNRRADLRSKKREPEAWTTDEMDRTLQKADNAKNIRNSKAAEMVGSRPGVIGKTQRAANVGAYKVGKFGKKMKDKATDFLHNKIGFEEE